MCHVSNCNITRGLYLVTGFWGDWGTWAISVGEPALLRTGTNYTGWIRLAPAHRHQPAHVNTPDSTQGSRPSSARHSCPSHAVVMVTAMQWQQLNSDMWSDKLLRDSPSTRESKGISCLNFTIRTSPLFLFQTNISVQPRKIIGLQVELLDSKRHNFLMQK